MEKKVVECLVCLEKLEYTDGNTEVLLDHLNDYHSHNEVFRYLGQYGKAKPIESGLQWKPKGTFQCPYCLKEGRPVLKRKDTNRSIKSKLAVIFWCWPLCCLPLFGSKRYVLQVFCGQCTKYIGFYNPETEKLTRSDHQ